MQIQPSPLATHIDRVLLRSKRRCALCFMDGIRQVREGSIVHLTLDQLDDSDDDLVFLCTDHCALIKTLDVDEIKSARNRLYSAMGVNEESFEGSKAPDLRFEELVADLLSKEFRLAMGENFSFSRRMMLPSKLRGALRQVDLTAEFDVAGLRFLTVIEAKHANKKLDTREIREFFDLVQDVGANKGILVANNGFTPEAIRLASVKGLALMTIPAAAPVQTEQEGPAGTSKPEILRIVS